jgi:hypothetical protein
MKPEDSFLRESPQLIPVFSQMNPVYNFSPYFLNIHTNIRVLSPNIVDIRVYTAYKHILTNQVQKQPL